MTISTTNHSTSGKQRCLLGLVLVIAAVAGVLWLHNQGGQSRLSELPTVPVVRSRLVATIRAAGDVDSSEKTLIECQLEALVFRNRNSSLRASGSASILEILPEGSMVKSGDVICRLDSSEYEEIVRQQEIEVEQDRAYYQGFQLDLESLEIRLREYRDGQLSQLEQSHQGQVALAEAELSRQESRLEWSQRMLELGYIPRGQFSADQYKMQQARITLDRQRLAYENLMKYTAPKVILSLEGQIESARARVTYFESRLRRNEEQLAHYREQVEHCTIRAPHDGFLIYANEDDDDTRIELGSTVRQNQDLFFLPDLGKMEVRATLHETVVSRVVPGMSAQVRVEALPDAVLEGEVIAVAPLPKSKRSWMQSDDVKAFEARVQLHAIPEGLMPGMSADVEIVTALRENALVVPPQAIRVEGGQDICYVADADHLERREVVLGAYHPDKVEVLQGLREGDLVLTDFESIEDIVANAVDVPISRNGGALVSSSVSPARVPYRDRPPLAADSRKAPRLAFSAGAASTL